MRKDILQKISIADMPLAVSDLTPEEKRRLYATITEAGGTESWAYKHFFQDGFSLWEIEGINQLKIRYLHMLHTDEKIEFEVRCIGDGVYGYFYQVDDEERSFDITKPGDFWQMLGDIRRRTHFSDFMATYGMRSAMTVAKRFSADDWRQYEAIGVKTIVENFIETAQN